MVYGESKKFEAFYIELQAEVLDSNNKKEN